MTDEKILNTLQNMGLSTLDAQLYLFLGKRGPKRVSELVQALKVPKQQLYSSLKNLQSKGVVNSTLEHPARFSVEPFEKILDLFVKAKMEEAQRIKDSKSDLLSDWQSIKIEEEKNRLSTFKVLEGNNYIYPKLKQMIEEAETQLSIVFTIPELARINQNEILNEIFSKISKSKIKLQILTEISAKNAKIIKILFPKKINNLEMRTPDLGLKLPNSMVIRDEDEVAFVIDSIENGADKQKNKCLWTNCKALVQSFSSVFEDSWNNATDIEKKVVEIESGKILPKTLVIKEANIAYKKYCEITRSAKKSIFILTSSAGLYEYCKKKNRAETWNKKGISIRIMAPILSENLKAARELMKICELKHVPASYVGTSIIDGQHLFQFNAPTSQREFQSSLEYFANTIYTDDSDYVKKTENMLNDIWNNAQYPSLIELKTIIQQALPSNRPANADVFEEHKKDLRKIIGFSYKMEPQQGMLTEKEVLNKIMKGPRFPANDPIKDTVRLYGSQANAVIYPKKDLNLPNFLIFIYCNNRKSSFGSENCMQINIQMKIGDYESYFPVAFVTDNSQGFDFRKALQKTRPNNEVVHLLRKDEFDIQSHGEKLIASWTVPIPLLPPKYVLPPACIVFEGYGKIRTYSSKMVGPINPNLTHDYNMLDAFVTFMHPSSSYHGPGSDGILLRESILTSYPPH